MGCRTKVSVQHFPARRIKKTPVYRTGSQRRRFSGELAYDKLCKWCHPITVIRTHEFRRRPNRKAFAMAERGDLPFRRAKRSEPAGTLAADGFSRAVFIMDGFMRAGTSLADLALKEPHSRFDLIYPMLFCYRHAVEAGLKWLITQYEPPVGVTPPDINDTHNLLKLWSYFKKINEACAVAAPAFAQSYSDPNNSINAYNRQIEMDNLRQQQQWENQRLEAEAARQREEIQRQRDEMSRQSRSGIGTVPGLGFCGINIPCQ